MLKINTIVVKNINNMNGEFINLQWYESNDGNIIGLYKENNSNMGFNVNDNMSLVYNINMSNITDWTLITDESNISILHKLLYASMESVIIQKHHKQRQFMYNDDLLQKAINLYIKTNNNIVFNTIEFILIDNIAYVVGITHDLIKPSLHVLCKVSDL